LGQEAPLSYYPQKSTTPKCSIIIGPKILPNETSILAMQSRCMDKIIREMTEIKINLNNTNKGRVLSEVIKASYSHPE
jgi:hypothetical protein